MGADTVIALSDMLRPYQVGFLREPEKSLTDETISRVYRSVCIYKLGRASSITMSGAHNPSNRTKLDERCTHAFAMAAYALNDGVPEDDIFIEDFSLDTVGQAIFTRAALAVPKKWKSMVVVSSDYHMPRVKSIFDFVYGGSCGLSYESAPTNEAIRAERGAKEPERLATFQKQFEGILPGDFAAIVHRLLDSEKGHGFYNGKRLLCSDVLRSAVQ